MTQDYMTILTNEELNLRKKEARKHEIRQNVKSHCTKIRDGIRKNSSTSANRAIWELFQNAGDLSDSAEIKIKITENAFVFAHKGKPFTYDSLCSLVKQVSSQEKEGDETVGQYGTGFLTTHTFSRKITINASMCISDNPLAYVDVTNFFINRENFEDIPVFIEDMTTQIEEVEKLMDTEQKSSPREWTELTYELNDERLLKVRGAIDDAIRLLPFVLTFNDNIGSCIIEDRTRDFTVSFYKEQQNTDINDLYCTRIWKSKDDGVPVPFDCFYLRLHADESRIILPLKSETEVRSLKGIPRLFVHFPLIGPDYFGVNFLFHSHRFTPEEARDNIIVPKDNDATRSIAEANSKILDEMTQYLWAYLEQHVATWRNTIKMASLSIKDSGYSETETENRYKDLKGNWVAEFNELKLIEIEGQRYCMNDENHPLVLDPALESFLSRNEKHDYLATLYSYAKETGLIPCQNELLEWSRIIAEWDSGKTSNFLTLECVVAYVSINRGENLLGMLKMLVDTEHPEFFDKYALLPNRNHELKKRGELRDARSITDELYKLVVDLDSSICTKFVNRDYESIVELPSYTRTNLRDELNSSVKEAEKSWKDGNAYDNNFERHLIALCSAFTTPNGESKRNKLMPIICEFENIDYEEKHIPAWADDDKSFDLYRNIFISLVENQMMKIDQKDDVWVKSHLNELMMFVDNARGDDYKSFCTRYAIYPNMNLCLHVPDELKKNANVNDKLFELYSQVFGEDLRNKCVHERFETFYEKYSEQDHQFTPQSVAKEIQNKLSDGKYSDTVLLDIIDLTEQSDNDNIQWQSLFKDIYDQRESIRYNLGSPTERKAINKMMKQKNPALLEMMANVSERRDAENVISTLQDTILRMDHDAHIKMLGEYVETHIQEYLAENLAGVGVNVRNEQDGKDLVLSKEGYSDYYVEIKSRWIDKEPVVMSKKQFENAVNHPDDYALISAQMWTFNQKRVEEKERVSLDEMKERIRILDNIGILEADLRKRVDDAFRGDESDIRAVGDYGVHVPQNIFKAYPCDFDRLVEKLKERFTK